MDQDEMMGSAGCHPLKRLRRQTLEETDDAMETGGRAAATVVNMR